MSQLLWIPRPLIVFAKITNEKIPCVQWHGQDWEGGVTEEQFLFPLCGKDSKLIECVREDFWRVRFLGSIGEWNKSHPSRPYAVIRNKEIWFGMESRCIIHVVTNELWRHADFSIICEVVARAEDGRLLTPHTYENPNVHDELPLYECDKEIQREWRRPYVENPSAIGEGTGCLNFFLSDEYHNVRTLPLYRNYLVGRDELIYSWREN